MKRHLSLITRFTILLVLFLIALLLQIGVSSFQHYRIISPMEESIENVQALSQVLNDVEVSLSNLASYRWDFGDVAAMVSSERNSVSSIVDALDSFEISEHASRQQHSLHSAVKATFRSYDDLLGDMFILLFQGDADEASKLYYSQIEPCGNYLRQYVQELIETNIVDSRDSQEKMMVMNRRLDIMQHIAAIASVLGIAALFIYMLYIISNIMDMDLAGRKLKHGDFGIPDLKVKRDDEVGNLARTFNEMKVSLKRQVELLEEKRRMESTLYKKDREALELQTLLEQEKLQQLRNQINPHFLFNTINVVKLKSQEEHAVETEAMLSSLARLFRYVLQSNDTECLLSREIRMVDEFYALTRARFGDKVNLVWNFSPDVDLTETIVPSFLLEPLVENAFKHGLGPKEGPGTVSISIGEDEGRLRIEIEDDGVGMGRAALEELRASMFSRDLPTDHIGVYNVAARLRLLSPDTVFDIDSEEGKGTRITVMLPLVVESEDIEEDDDDQDSDS